MKKNNLNEKFNIAVYAEGPNPTGRDVQNISAMFEVAAYMATVNFCFKRESDKYRDMVTSYNDFILYKYFSGSSKADKSYNTLVDLVIASFIRLPFSVDGLDTDLKDKMRFRTSERLSDIESQIYRLRHETHRNEDIVWKKGLISSPDFLDLNEWLAVDYGNRLVEVAEINTKNSIELLFNIASMGAILGFQNIPEIKDSALYIESVIKGWMTKENTHNPQALIGFPKLPVSLERTICKYDDVELSQSKEGAITIKLKRY